MSERIAIVDTIIERDGKILMLKRNYHPVGKLDFPGGFVDAGETIEQAAVREAKEETGLTVELTEKFGAFDYTDRGEKTAHVFLGKIVGGEVTASNEGTPLWTGPALIQETDLAFPQVHWKVLHEYLNKRKVQ
ncbi:MAG: NUDIX hydrolase [Patescibacteria group bacterium]|nr:NUDIX hydrolase [Patescibacteria group bacterium]